MKRRTILAGGVGAILALGLTVVGCSVAYIDFYVDATNCPAGTVYEVVGEFKDNPQNDKANRWIVTAGSKRFVHMWPHDGGWSRERIEVKVYEVPPPPAPKRLVKETILTVVYTGPTQTVEICSPTPSTP